MNTGTAHAKDRLRQRIWDLLDGNRVGRSGPVHGEIPDFHGADRAAARLAEHPRWVEAPVVKANPDRAQAEVRRHALESGKLLYTAVPGIAAPEPFHEIDPAALPASPAVLATGRGAALHAPRTPLDRMRPVDVVVCGSVAVNRQGVRIGKGAGYSDIEMALLAQAGLIGERTLVVTTVHTLQLIDEPVPAAEHDVGVDLVVTPDEIVECPPGRRPSGIDWQVLDEEKISAIPVLEALRRDLR
ncbi:5-formyltetrahydrofolate cyclo-ligase [Nocardiopsis ganjiahuensis]|uniref:5-formyltetrahydrofolate cyclo-ligase n=1 Tax=Nocardiopsis ganjiahuensis TaxID=239984 RepID=UPI0003607A61|nr:5-formyltetrahydrofolate cyclo-ligase [Nocardiopsis ganjiahuensis]